MKTEEQTAGFVEAVAAHHNWTANPDSSFRDTLVNGLTANFNSYGYYLCPCRDGWADRAKDSDIICPCKYAADDISEYGHCYCALYLDKDFAADKREVQSIPERRDPDLFP